MRHGRLICALGLIALAGCSASSTKLVAIPPTPSTLTVSLGVPTTTSTTSTTSTSTTSTSTSTTSTTSTTTPPTTAPRGKTYAFGDSQSGAHQTLKPGDAVTITLAANETTPYAWTITQATDPSVMRLLANRYVPGPCQPGMTGCGGTQVLGLIGAGAGSTSIALAYQAISGPAGLPPARTYTLSFTVS